MKHQELKRAVQHAGTLEGQRAYEEIADMLLVMVIEMMLDWNDRPKDAQRISETLVDAARMLHAWGMIATRVEEVESASPLGKG
jgi:hypothetical protein